MLFEAGVPLFRFEAAEAAFLRLIFGVILVCTLSFVLVYNNRVFL